MFWFAVSTSQPLASYAVEADFAQGAATAPTLAVFNSGDVGPAPMCSAGASTVTTRDISGLTPAAPNGQRLSFLKTTAGAATFLIRVSNPGLAGEALTLRVAETTQYNPRWSTFGGFHTEFGFRNTTSDSLNGTVTLFNPDGSVNTSKDLLIPVSETAFADTRPVALIGPTGMDVPNDNSGSAVFTHDGPPGSIIADVFIVHPGFPSGPFVVPGKFEPVRASAASGGGGEGTSRRCCPAWGAACKAGR